MQYIQACLLTKQNFFWYFDAGLEHLAARPRCNGTYFDLLRYSCEISACDLSPKNAHGISHRHARDSTLKPSQTTEKEDHRHEKSAANRDLKPELHKHQYAVKP